jgi:hypothetical protein
MISPVENILQNLITSSLLQDTSAEQLQQIINTHPYYGAVHFLLAKKLYLQKEPGNENTLQKAVLHFSNDLWFHFILNDIEEKNIAKKEIIIQPDDTTAEKENDETDHSLNTEPGEILKKEEEIKTVEEVSVLQTDELETAEEELAEENIEANDAINAKLSSMLQQQAAAFEKPVESVEEISIENTPYHRVDYFDSQGIKLDEEKANDKLGTQLKRFTEWLKQMKRVNPNPTELSNDEAGESQVQNIAEHSNESGEIVTETMAEVLIKQGKPEQAVQIYEKLSFIYPAKSAYFAAKIQDLKG